MYVNHPELTGFFRFSITGDSGFLAVFSTVEPDGRRDTHMGVDISTQAVRRPGAHRPGQ
jgi:hypothetical protein